MAFPTTAVLETFTGADGTSPPNSHWSNGINGGSGIEIRGNQAETADASNSYGTGWWNTTQFGPDVEAFVSVASKSEENDQIGLAIRVQSPGSGSWDGYVVNWDTRLAATDEITVWAVVNDNGTPLGTVIYDDMAVGDKLGVEMIGNTLKVYRYRSGTWTLLGTYTDSTITGAGYIGINLRNANASGGNMRADDFGGGTVVAGLTLDDCVPDGDIISTGWTPTPLYSKLNDASDATVMQGTAVT